MLKNYASFEKIKLIRLLGGLVVFATGITLEKIFQKNGRITLVVFILSFLLLGGDVILRALKNIIRGKVFDENFLMSIATTGALAIGEHSEAAAVMLFYQIGEFFQDMAVKNTKNSITSLMNIRPDYANLIKNGVVEKAAPESVNPGELIIVKPGEKIPLDGIVTEGESLLDASSLTGESIPQEVSPSSTVLSGCVNKIGKLTIKVTKTFGESTVSKIINLVENASGKKSENGKFYYSFR
jgi:Cd2+/Zn2+-exporting ATPase